MKLLTAFLPVIPMCLMLLAQTPAGQQPATQPAAAPNASTSSNGQVDRNQKGRWRKIKVKSAIPAGATAQCQDKTYSNNEHVSGTCAGHGGVEKWLKPVTLE